MAKWGEGDPRWLVEHRDDGTNVNGWHWTERSKIEWSRQRIGELFTGVPVLLDDPSKATLVFARVKELAGDASITIRKGNRKFAVFDLTLALAWQGTLAGSDKQVKGEVRVEEIHSTGDEDDYLYSVTVEGAGEEQDACKALVMGAKAQVLSLIAQYVQDLQGQQ